MRTGVVWVPDWPVLAALTVAGLGVDVPAAVHDGHGVLAASAVARAHGVRRGMRRRQAQQACPEVVLLAADDVRDVREFEPVASAAESVVAGLEVARPGLLLLPADGPARFHGSEAALAEALAGAVAHRTGHECHVGIADGVLAAVLAAREEHVVPPGRSREFCDPRPLGDLLHAVTVPGAAGDVADLVGLWGRLGLRTFADLRALPAADVATRFGDVGAWAHRLARGEDLRPPARRRIEPDLAVARDLDPPAERVDTAAFVARALAEELYGMLVARTVTCGRLRIAAVAQHPVDGTRTELVRTWRCDDEALGGLSASRLTDRVRWQLEGWLTASAVRQRPGRRAGGPRGDDPAGRPAPIVRIELTAEDVVRAGTHQGGLWGASSGQEARARRALERVQGLLGGEQVLGVRLQGGRDARDRVQVAPWGDAAPPARPADRPWPGSLPEPSPANVLARPVAVGLLDPRGEPVTLDDAGRLVVPPGRLVPETPGATGRAVHQWAGPWTVDERWWSSDARAAAYLQVVLDDGRGALLAGTGTGPGTAWRLEALYD
ncbi:Y-family DNA polymerase [Luteimicrobium subarcticum]|uniref:Protein ImuB n=1 Tax=Luteimicrobium subarcticum TaxID=620910 RepID=A0A2M8W3L9_9MICO|nr:DNA polymerase Y family protein [Luteimicrobium subarcticum]PJI85514.1 protein ImuB [Luteimicrobium subarcticum]